MHGRTCVVLAAFVMVASAGNAQRFERRAQITGGGDRDRGRCTIEVIVDGNAEVEIRGDSAILRTLGGRPAEWRRFECSAPMPPDPANFHFSGIDGRGRQELVGEPRAGVPAVVRIEDRAGGAERYAFEIGWSYRGDLRRGPPPSARDDDRRRDDRDRPRDRRFTVEEAIQVCKDAVSDQARDRFPGGQIVFRRTAIDDNPGRNDWVMGTLEVHRMIFRPTEVYHFSCSVNFDTGRVRSAQIDSDRWRGR